MTAISEYALQALRLIRDECKRKNVKSGIIDNITGTLFLAKKISKSGEPKTIGFFGAQKRGKSSLINQLLRCDLMPVSAIPMSSVVIKVKHDKCQAQGKFTIDTIRSNGSLTTTKDVDISTAQMHLKQYGSHKGGKSVEVDTITVTSNFGDSKILEDGGILVDTPGAEIAFDSKFSTEVNSVDAQRAIKILESTHIIIFIERADLMQSNNSKIFFSKHLKSMRPFSVINWKDAYNLDSKFKISDPLNAESKKQSCMQEIMLETYEVNLDRVMCVSSKEAAEARKNGNKDLLRISNLPELERRILTELHNLDPDIGLITCITELKKIFQQLDVETVKNIIAPARRPLFLMMMQQGELGKNSSIASVVKELYDEYFN